MPRHPCRRDGADLHAGAGHGRGEGRRSDHLADGKRGDSGSAVAGEPERPRLFRRVRFHAAADAAAVQGKDQTARPACGRAALRAPLLHLQRLQRQGALDLPQTAVPELQSRDPRRQHEGGIPQGDRRLRRKAGAGSRAAGGQEGVQSGQPEPLPHGQDGLRLFRRSGQRRGDPALLPAQGIRLFCRRQEVRRGAGAARGDGGEKRVPAPSGHERTLERADGAGHQEFLRRERAARARHGGQPRLLRGDARLSARRSGGHLVCRGHQKRGV